jgi:hypothetical protein
LFSLHSGSSLLSTLIFIILQGCNPCERLWKVLSQCTMWKVLLQCIFVTM